MDWDSASKVIVGTLGGGAALAKVIADRTPRRGQRDQIRRDLEILAALPQESSMRVALLAHVDRSVTRLIGDEEEKRRDPVGIGLAIGFFVLSALVASFALRDGGSPLWWLLFAPLFLFGCVGLAQDGVARKRDDRGRPVKED